MWLKKKRNKRVQSQKGVSLQVQILRLLFQGQPWCDSFMFLKFPNFLPICKYLYVCVCAQVCLHIPH